MSVEYIEGGYFIIARHIFESDLWEKPPYFIKLWIFLIGQACHQERRYRGFVLRRGQCFLTYGDLLEEASYYVGARKEKYTVGQMKHFMKFLRDTGRITTSKEPRGVVITILNYEKYQNPENYGRTKERAAERTSIEPKTNRKQPSINNKVNNENNSNYTEERKKLLRHIEKTRTDISNPDAYISKLERKTNTKAVAKAMNDWRHCSFSVEQFWERTLYHHAKLQGLELKIKPTSPPADADD